MTSGIWDEVISRYQEVYIFSRYPEHVRGILKLIPRIRDEPGFDMVIPSTSLMVLRLGIPDSVIHVCVWCERENEEYSVSFQDGKDEWVKVSDEEIIVVLLGYIQKLRPDGE